MTSAPTIHLLGEAEYERPDFTVLAEGLAFPEGPVAMPDGSVLLVELSKGLVSRVSAKGEVQPLAAAGTCLNGLAAGPDGLMYICNNGSALPSEQPAAAAGGPDGADYLGGSIQTFDLATGALKTLYDRCPGGLLSAPNDIVFDGAGGFYFTCLGKRHTRLRGFGGLYYARADGSEIREIAYPVFSPNGIGLSPDGRTLYYAETDGCRLWAYDIVEPGVLDKSGAGPDGSRLVATLGGYQKFDSLAVEASGNICVATLVSGTVTVFSPDGGLVRQVYFGDHFTTNICFGGPERSTAYVTLSRGGRLVALDWGVPGLLLNHAPR